MTPASESRPAANGDWNTIRTLAPYLWPVGQTTIRARVVAAVICLVLAKVATVYVPILYKEAVDLISGGTDFALTALISIIIGYGLVRVAQQAFGEFREFFFARVGQRAIRTVALKTFRHLHALSLRFHLDRQTGGLSRAIERGVKGIEFLLNFMLFSILPTLIEIAMVCGILWYFFDVWYALVTFVTVAGYIVFTMVVTEWRLKFRRRMNEQDQTANTRAIDSLLNFETVKYFGNERHEADRYDGSLRRYEDAAVASRSSLSLLNVGQGFIIAGGLIVLMSMAGYGVKSGVMSVGDFVMVNTYLIQLFLPLNFLGFVYREMKQSLADMEAMFRLLGIEREVADRPDAEALPQGPGRVSFENVRFAYREDRPILRGISFTVEPGQTVAIVGPSGAGKSTISRLLFRFYDVGDGAVRIDESDIREVTQQSVRAALGIVPQDTVLFNDTIYYNIAYGRPEATPSEVEAAARHASIHDFIMGLPDGYQTSVGERGLKLSGGEKQRVAIARTILKNPRIYVFDEATSALDSHTEQAIQESLREVSRGRTTLVIAHRLSTIVDADQILVLEAGRIVERGRHADLLTRGGRYAAMWRRQQETRDEEASGSASDGVLVPG
ncbi:MAG: ABC transporter ATP-binding protein/permease [Alphaproteobacteria bacterium]|nr:ABC transporter ATP-binding protein/permease [Alphaproteobacteria bacterium]